MSEPAGLRVQGVHKRFRKQHALRDLSFDVPRGSLTVLLGAAGAGKTTALRTIAGLEEADQGEIWIGGRDCTHSEPRERDLAMLFENLALYPNLTVFENIAYPLRLRREDPGPRVRAIAAALRIGELLDRLPRALSGGERQRVALGRVLVRQPALCLLDEPLASLDAMLRRELRAELQRLQRELGFTFVLATPDYVEAMALADQVVALRAGRVVQVASAQALYEHPVDRELARFVGAPEINLLAGSALDGHLHVAGAKVPLRAPLQGELEVGLRPEHVRLVEAGAGDAAGKISDIEPLGHKVVVTVANAHGELRVVVEARRGCALGDHVGLAFAEAPWLAFSLVDGKRLA